MTAAEAEKNCARELLPTTQATQRARQRSITEIIHIATSLNCNNKVFFFCRWCVQDDAQYAKNPLTALNLMFILFGECVRLCVCMSASWLFFVSLVFLRVRRVNISLYTFNEFILLFVHFKVLVALFRMLHGWFVCVCVLVLHSLAFHFISRTFASSCPFSGGLLIE